MIKERTKLKKFIDFIFFPFRAFALIEKDKWGLSCLASERFYYVAKQVQVDALMYIVQFRLFWRESDHATPKK